jgi:hypothetical protein
MTSRPIYDDPFNPIYEGSGGGGTSNSSAGGGVIFIEAMINLTIEGRIDSSAVNLEDTYSQTQYDGGASGGTVQIKTIYLVGNGTVMANGGNANTSKLG